MGEPEQSSRRSAAGNPRRDKPVLGARERSKAELHARIYDAARRLFVAKGFQQTKVEEIAAELGISTVTVFNHFRRKDLLLLEMAEEMFSHFERFLLRVASGQDGAPVHVSEYLILATEGFEGYPEVNRPLLSDMAQVALREPAGRQLLVRLHDALVQVSAAAQARGEVRSDVTADAIAEMVANLLIGSLVNWIHDPVRSSEERVRAAAFTIQDFVRPR